MKLVVCIYTIYNSGKQQTIKETTFTRTTFVLARHANQSLAPATPGLRQKIPVFSDPAPEKYQPLPMNKWVPEQPSPWRKSSQRESCYGDRVQRRARSALLSLTSASDESVRSAYNHQLQEKRSGDQAGKRQRKSRSSHSPGSKRHETRRKRGGGAARSITYMHFVIQNLLYNDFLFLTKIHCFLIGWGFDLQKNEFLK